MHNYFGGVGVAEVTDIADIAEVWRAEARSRDKNFTPKALQNFKELFAVFEKPLQASLWGAHGGANQ